MLLSNIDESTPRNHLVVYLRCYRTTAQYTFHPNFFQHISEILSFCKMGVVDNKDVALWMRRYSTIFQTRKIDLSENVSPASKDGTQSCFYDCKTAIL